MEITMNTRKSLYDVKSFYDKKAILKASFQGMRYQVERVEKEGEEPVLRATVWPEPFSFEKTPEEEKIYKEFPDEEEGLDEAYEWLCHMFQEENAKWTTAQNTPWVKS
jgi:hypothetical protein